MKASDMARALAKKMSDKVRAARLAPEDKRRIAALGGHSRALSLHAVRRISENFRYVEVIDALQPRPRAVRLQDFDGPLPGIHAGQAQRK
jgi:hypothetical protein